MHWFGGSIAEAVTLSKQKNAIFVVFVEGDNDLSKELADTIDNDSVLTRLSNQDKFLAIKLKSGTDNYTYFAQIYQFVPVPSLFFIGRNGTPLEVVCAGIEAQNLASRIDLIIEEHSKEGSIPPARPSTSAQSVKEHTQSLLQSEARANTPQPSGSAAPAAESLKKPSTEATVGPAAKVQKTDTAKPQEYEVVCDGDVCVRKPKDDQASTSQVKTQPIMEPAASESAAMVDDKVERAKELIEIKRREKAEKEKELEKQRELERRSVGQGVAELKRWQAEQELKQIQEERKKEKMENALARQRILDQIAQDRAERRAREAREAAASAPAPAPASAPLRVDAGGAGGASGASTARLQLKLPDGGSHVAQFPAAATLADVRRYVADNLQLPSSQFSVWTAFPRRELTDADASLAALGLAPSAALLLLPRANAPVRAQPSPAGLIALLTQLFTSMILDPTYRAYNWLRDQLFPRGAGAGGEGAGRGEGRGAGGGGERGAGAGGLRRRGNVHRLGGDRDDDNNTWNGNSTQQM